MMPKRPPKDDRERMILFKLIEIYLDSGAPVGSTTVMEEGFLDLSSATIRNYFSKLEKGGYLKQQHSSGGRIPTDKGFRLYALACLEEMSFNNSTSSFSSRLAPLKTPTKEVALYLQKGAEILSDVTRCSTFISSPRFDQDFVIDIKLTPIDHHRLLCLLITDFGVIHTEILYVERGLAKINFDNLLSFLRWRVFHTEKPILSSEEESICHKLYKEVMLRHLVSYSNQSKEDIYKTGFSKLLEHPDFNTTAALANGLSLLENEESLRTVLQIGSHNKKLSVLIGSDLEFLSPPLSGCAIILIPYRIHQTIAGTIALFGPTRMPYKELFALLQEMSNLISETLTHSLYKFKITFRSTYTLGSDQKTHSLGMKNQYSAALHLLTNPYKDTT